MSTQRTTLLALLLTTCLSMSHAFKTQGDGTTYTFEKLAQTEGTGVTKADDKTYIVLSNDTIAEGDTFTLAEDFVEGMTVKFGNEVTFVIEGKAELSSPICIVADGDIIDGDFPIYTYAGSIMTFITFTKNGEDDVPYGIKLSGANADEFVKVYGLRFEYLGLANYSESDVQIDNCEFYRHNGSQSGALFLGSSQKTTYLTGSTFSECGKAAIGGAANYSCPIYISYCLFQQNSQNNQNIPQLNLTAAADITIIGCRIEGDPTKNMVGGIGVSNFMSYPNTNLAITECKIEDNRYGIGTVGPIANIRIDDCTLLNNRYESNPMNGGSGISLYDPYQQTQAVVSGCHIEGSLWGVTIIGCKNVNLGCLDKSGAYNPGGNVFKDNGNGGQLYDLYNNSTLTVYAQNNTWNVSEQTQEQIETVIFHKADDASLGEVIYWPAAANTGIRTIDHSQLTNDHYYGLDGIHRSAPQKGINIVNGKKVVY